MAGKQSTTLPEPKLPTRLRKLMLPARDAYHGLQGRRGRYAVYSYMHEVYLAYLEIEHYHLTKSLENFALSDDRAYARNDAHPFRLIIDYTSNEPDKVKSRWCRALECAHQEDVTPRKLRRFLIKHGGIAGCARLAAQKLPLAERTRHWTD
jgi:hypothetical protein